jgi:hypothetical protein
MTDTTGSVISPALSKWGPTSDDIPTSAPAA